MKIPKPKFVIGQRFWSLHLNSTIVPEIKCKSCGVKANNFTHYLAWEVQEQQVFAINIHIGPTNYTTYGALIQSFISNDDRLERKMFKTKKAAEQAAKKLNGWLGKKMAQ